MRFFRVPSHIVVLFALMALTAVGCAKTVPQEVTDVNRQLGQAKDACASVYAADALRDVQGSVDSMNALADDKKYKKARKEAEPLLPRVDELAQSAASAKAQAKSAAESAISAAKSKVDAARGEQAAQHASSEFNAAQSKMSEAEAAFRDPCRYRDAARLAQEAGQAADRARTAAIAEKKRLEEERLRAEAERKRREEEEARRRAEEERLRMFPPTYTVQKGDSLWKISGMQTVYKKSAFWPILFDANKDKIQDPDLIYPGQVLSIPRGMSDQEMADKLARLWRSMGSGDAQ